MRVFEIKNSPAEAGYRGSGRGMLVVNFGIPELLVYEGDDAKVSIPTENTEVYWGMASCYEFVVEREMKFW